MCTCVCVCVCVLTCMRVYVWRVCVCACGCVHFTTAYCLLQCKCPPFLNYVPTLLVYAPFQVSMSRSSVYKYVYSLIWACVGNCMHACHGGINCYDILSFCILTHGFLYSVHIHMIREHRKFDHTQVFSSDHAYIYSRSVIHPCIKCACMLCT